MAELSELGRRLIAQASIHDVPPSADESWGALVSRLTSEGPRAPLPFDEHPTTVGTARGMSLQWWLVGAVLVLLAGVATWFWSNPHAAPEPAPSVAPTRAPTPAPPRAAVAPPVEPAPAELIADAEAALAADDAARALELLERHAERAPIGPEAEHRMALRVLALCKLGREAQARAEANAFRSGHPESKWQADLARSCARD